MTFPFDGSRRLIVLPVEVFGPAGSVILQFALDTGASVTLANVGVLVLLGYDPALETERVQVTTGSGVEFVPRVTVSKIVALGQGRTAFPLLAHTLPPSAAVDGLLGLDFFRNQRLVIDFKSGNIQID